MQYESVFFNQKTSLKKECYNDKCLASEFDNIWYDKNKIRVVNSEVILFYRLFSSLKEARKISDHIPIGMEFNMN
jgi:hypothetical protein